MKTLVKKWLSKYQKYFFSYRDGFFELPFLANSPEHIVESFKSMPFIKNDEKTGMFSTSNLFIKGKGYYQELEKGLWIILSDFEIKRDLSFKMIYDPDSSANYHTLILYINTGTQKVKLPNLIDIEFQDRGWMLLKTGGHAVNTHFKGQRSIYLNIYFDESWLQHNMLENGIFLQTKLREFFDSDSEYLYMPNLLESKQEVYEQLVEIFQNRTEISNLNTLLIKGKTYELLANFVELLDKSTFYSAAGELTEKNKRKIIKMQHFLDQIVVQKFPSIQILAQKAGMSETKLKADFKVVNGMTIYQYFTMKKMQYARDLLKNNQVSIKEIAITLGYENQSKFSQAYKRIFGYLPSDTILTVQD